MEEYFKVDRNAFSDGIADLLNNDYIILKTEGLNLYIWRRGNGWSYAPINFIKRHLTAYDKISKDQADLLISYYKE